MGVTYKLKDEVVRFIISQRQSSPLSSCRQLAEAVSVKFGLRLSKSSVHDVLKESGIVTPRGRKPKNTFKIPQEKKKQIQESLSQVKLLVPPVDRVPVLIEDHAQPSVILGEAKDPKVFNDPLPVDRKITDEKREETIDPLEYEGAGNIFLKAARWDLGIFSEGEIREKEWLYYLTYSKGIKVTLENDKNFFIELPLPLERCIRETADGLVNNVKPFIADKVSDKELFEASMEARPGFKIINFTIVDQYDHEILIFDNIIEFERAFLFQKRVFVENYENDFMKRAKSVFLSQTTDNINFMDNLMNLRGFNGSSQYENVVTLLVDDVYGNKFDLQEAAERINGMYLRDEKDKLVKVKIQSARG